MPGVPLHAPRPSRRHPLMGLLPPLRSAPRHPIVSLMALPFLSPRTPMPSSHRRLRGTLPPHLPRPPLLPTVIPLSRPTRRILRRRPTLWRKLLTKLVPGAAEGSGMEPKADTRTLLPRLWRSRHIGLKELPLRGSPVRRPCRSYQLSCFAAWPVAATCLRMQWAEAASPVIADVD
jgi:hypothetical protein